MQLQESGGSKAVAPLGPVIPQHKTTPLADLLLFGGRPSVRSLDPIRSLPLLRLLLTVIQPGSCWDPHAHGCKIEKKYIAQISIDRPFPFSALSRQTNYVYPTRLPFFSTFSFFSPPPPWELPRVYALLPSPPWSNTCVAAHHNRALPTSITRASRRRMTGRFKDRNHVELRD